jgi:hypothetical protein
MDLRPRLVLPALALVAVIPGALFLLARGELVVLLSTVSVVLIAASLYYVFSPADGEPTGSDGDGPFPG